MLSLDTNELHFWLCDPAKLPLDESSYLTELLATLDEEEHQRMRRFKFERHALQFRISHSLVRYVLSQYGDVLPADWRYTKNEHGKPFRLRAKLVR